MMRALQLGHHFSAERHQDGAEDDDDAEYLKEVEGGAAQRVKRVGGHSGEIVLVWV